DWMRIAPGIQRLLQVPLKPVDGHPNGADGLLCLPSGSRWVLPLPSVKLLEFALDFGFYGFGRVFVVEDGFKFELFAAQRSDGVGVVKGEVSLLENRVAGENHVFTRGWVDDLGDGRAVQEQLEVSEALDFQGHAVDGFVRRVEEEIDHIISALLVIEDGFLAVEGEVPKADVFRNG